MRVLLSSIALLALGALGVFGCSSSIADDTSGLACGFVRDQENCWRVFVRGVDACLGTAPADPGLLAEDRKTCTYGDRSIRSDNTPINDTATEKISRNFSVMRGGRMCLQVIETDTSLEATSEGKRIAYSAVDGELTLVCPNGTKLVGTFDRLFDCLSYDGGVPGTATSATLKRGNYRLLGMKGPAYDCALALK